MTKNFELLTFEELLNLPIDIESLIVVYDHFELFLD